MGSRGGLSRYCRVDFFNHWAVLYCDVLWNPAYNGKTIDRRTFYLFQVQTVLVFIFHKKHSIFYSLMPPSPRSSAVALAQQTAPSQEQGLRGIESLTRKEEDARMRGGTCTNDA